MKNLPIIHPATNITLPEVVLTIQGYPAEVPNVMLNLPYSAIAYQGRQPTTPHTDKLLARAISKQATLIGWWLSNLYQCDVHPTAPWNISRNFKVVIGPWSFTLRNALVRLSLGCYSSGKRNEQASLIELGA